MNTRRRGPPGQVWEAWSMLKLSVGTGIHLPTLLVIPSQPSRFLHQSFQLILIAGVTKQAQVHITMECGAVMVQVRWGGGGGVGGGIKRCLSSAEVLMSGLEESISLLLLSRGSVGRLSHSYSSSPIFTLSVTLWPCHLFTSVVFSHSHVSLFSGLFASYWTACLHCFSWFTVGFSFNSNLWMIVIQTNHWWKSPFLMDGWQLGGFKCKLIWVLNLPYWLLVLYIKIIDPRRDLRPWTAFLKTANSQLILVIRKTKTCSKEIVQTILLVNCFSLRLVSISL